jgi:Ni,Fe-hydrogenase I cytochrome b subunit
MIRVPKEIYALLNLFLFTSLTSFGYTCNDEAYHPRVVWFLCICVCVHIYLISSSETEKVFLYVAFFTTVARVVRIHAWT